MVDDALFRSRLSRLKTALELEEKIWKETGEEGGDEEESEYLTKELSEMGRRNVSLELVKEFEACLIQADKFYAETQRLTAEETIASDKAGTKD